MRAAAPPPTLPALRFGTAGLGWLAASLVVVLAAGWLFSTGLAYVAAQWSLSEYSHGWLVPVISLYVLWSRRQAIMATWGSGSWSGVAVTALALVLVVLSAMAFVQRGPYVALILLLGGLGLAAMGGRAMRYALIPLVFLTFAFPLPGSMQVPLSTSLQLVSSQLGAWMLDLLGISVFLEGNIIDLGSTMKLQVAEACSGLRYLFPLLCFGFICAWIFKAPFWARALVLLSTVPITILTNSARIALTGVFVEYGNEELAEGFLHLFEGWLIFGVALLLLFLLMSILAKLVGGGRGALDLLDFDRLAGGTQRPAARTEPAPRGVPAPFVACAGMLLAAALAYGPLTARTQIIPARPGLVTLPLTYEGWRGRPAVIEDQSVLRALGADDYMLADFEPASGLGAVNFWVAYYDEQLGDAAIHSPKDCLPGGGWEYVTLEQVEAPVPNAAGLPFKFNRGVIAQGLNQMVIYYWLDMRGRQMTGDTTLKIYNLWDSYALGRSDGALVRLMSPVQAGEKIEDVDRRMRDLLAKTYPGLQPHLGL